MKMNYATKCEAALDYASRGWAVLPLKPDNTPLTSNGVKDATSERVVIKDWWEQWPEANVAIATGERSHLVVIHLDWPDDGPNVWGKLQEEVQALPDADFQSSGSDGFKYYFEFDGPCQSRTLGAGVELKADDDYVVAPPSIHRIGKQRWVQHIRGSEHFEIRAWIERVYRWINNPFCSRRPGSSESNQSREREKGR